MTTRGRVRRGETVVVASQAERPRTERPQTEGPPVVPAAHGSMTNAPPWIGGVTIGTLFLSAAVLVTYTLIPLPGQESLGDVNYLVAGLLFAVHLGFTRLYRTRLAHRTPARGPDAPSQPAQHSRPAQHSQQTGPDRTGAPAE